MLVVMPISEQQRAALRARFNLPTVVEKHAQDFELVGEELEKAGGTKRGGGGQQQGFDAFGRYIGRVGVRSPKFTDPEAAHMDLGHIVKEDPKFEERLLGVMRQVPGFEVVRSHEEAVNRIAQHIMETADRTPDDLAEMAKKWYPLGHEFNKGEALRHGVHPDVAHAVTARLSPQKDWFHNLAMSRATMRRLTEDPVIDKATVDQVNAIRIAAWEDKKNPRIPKPDQLDPRAIVGKRLSELDDFTAGEMIRPLTDQVGENYTINIDGSPVLGANGKLSGIAWQSGSTMASAVRMFRNPTAEVAHEVLGQAHKIRSFYENLRDPHNEAGFDDVTVDTHAMGLGTGIPLSSSHPLVAKMFGSPKSTKSGIAGVYPLFVEANRLATQRAGSRYKNSSEMQAVTWEGQRMLWPRSAKRKWAVAAIERIRTAEANGRLSHDAANDLVETLRLQLPGVATGGGTSVPSRIKGVPEWALEG